MSNDNDKDLILKQVDKLEDMFKGIINNMKLIEECKEKIIFTHGVKLDDIKFYTSLINNTLHYYKKNVELRKCKLSKDLKTHYNILRLSEYLGDICFNKEVIEKILDSYNEKKNSEKNKATKFANECYWIKDVYYDEINDWPKQLYALLIYHSFLLKPLYNSSCEEAFYFILKKKQSTNLSKNCTLKELKENYDFYDDIDNINININDDDVSNKNNLKNMFDSLTKCFSSYNNDNIKNVKDHFLGRTNVTAKIKRKHESEKNLLNDKIIHLEAIITSLEYENNNLNLELEDINSNQVSEQTHTEEESNSNQVSEQTHTEEESNSNQVSEQTHTEEESNSNQVSEQTHTGEESNNNDGNNNDGNNNDGNDN